ncbi:magnesium-translocating P-type ATPase [Rickettsiales bacterium LUAb2]
MMLGNIKNTLINLINKSIYSSKFQRTTPLDALKNKPLLSSSSEEIINNLFNIAKDQNHILKNTNSNKNGLTEEEVEQKQNEYGLNEINYEKQKNFLIHIFICFRNPFNILLSVLAIISFLTEDMVAGIIITTMVVVSTLLRFIQETKSKIATDKLKVMVSNTITVVRQYDLEDESTEKKDKASKLITKSIEIPITELVPGDVIMLSAGDMIPADLCIINAKDLFISQAVLTGESMPVEKFATIQNINNKNLLELDNIAFSGTNVISGAAKAVVIATGNNTYFGALASKIIASNNIKTQFQIGISKVSWYLIKLMAFMVPVVFFINGFTKGNWMDAALFALSVAVGLTPEMLPMIVTSTLAKGAVFMAKKKVIVKKLEAIQNFGAMDVLCTDKTGTLTQDKIVLERYTDIDGEVYDKVLSYAYLNSYYQTGLRNLLDVAVLEHIELNKSLDIKMRYSKVDEIPFDFKRRRMSVVVTENKDHNLLICKGALEEVLAVSTKFRKFGKESELTKQDLQNILAVTENLNKEGLRVVAVATKELPLDNTVYSIKDENNLTLIGYVAFLDPPKESTAPALAALNKAGVKVKILTGDNDLVAKKVCKDVNLDIKGVLLGEDIDQMTDKQLKLVVDDINVFAKLTPDHKERVIAVLRQKGHTVGFMGDGINDAPALRMADIGISVDTAVDIAKESADLILLEKSLMVLEEGIKEGRKTFANMLKYIKITASSNFGNVFSVLIASAFIPFLPMLPIHILIQNLLYDISQIVIPFDKVDEESLAKPQKWNSEELGKFMIFFGPISSIFDIITYCVMWFVFGANTSEKQSLFQTGWFVEGLLSQTLIVHAIRTRKIPFINSIASLPLLIMTSLVIIIGILIPFSPFAHYLSFQALPFSYFIWLVFILLAYMLTVQSTKSIYSKLYGWR